MIVTAPVPPPAPSDEDHARPLFVCLVVDKTRARRGAARTTACFSPRPLWRGREPTGPARSGRPDEDYARPSTSGRLMGVTVMACNGPMCRMRQEGAASGETEPLRRARRRGCRRVLGQFLGDQLFFRQLADRRPRQGRANLHCGRHFIFGELVGEESFEVVEGE